MHPQLRLIVNRIKAEQRRPNPAAVQTATQEEATTRDGFTVRQQLQRDIVNAGIKYEVTPGGLAQACDELTVDYHTFTQEFVTWL